MSLAKNNNDFHNEKDMFMKRITAYLTMMLALTFSVQLYAQDNNEGEENEGKPLTVGKEIWTQDASKDGTQTADGNNSYHYFDNRQAMAGKGYSVNKMVMFVSVGGFFENLDNLTDEDLDNYTSRTDVVGASIAAGPVVSVRSSEHYFDAGTEAGFCMVASSGDNVLSLDVVKAMSIGIYRDGVLLETLAVEEGQSASGIGLSLIKIPGTEDACVYLTVKPTQVFDEVCLVNAGGVNLSVGGTTRIKYAYVGSPKETKLTHNGIADYMTEDRDKIKFKEYKGWNPVLLGIPWPFLDGDREELVDDDSDNGWEEFAPLTPIISVGYQGGARLIVEQENSDAEGEVFKAGDEVGFKYINASAVDLGIGSTVTICLFNKKGDKIDEQTVSSGVLALAVGNGGYATASIVANQDFSGAELRFYTGLAVNLGTMGVCYGFVRQKADVAHNCPINPTVSTNVCDAQNSYQLESNPNLSIAWSLVSQPYEASANVTQSGKVTNMTKQGEYVFRATCLSCPYADTSNQCYEEITLTVGEQFSDPEKMEELMGTPLVNKEGEAEKYKAPKGIGQEGSGALVSISDLNNRENLVSPSYDDYATYVGGLGVANNLCVSAVQTNDASLIYDGSQHEGTQFKAGFVVRNETTGLNLSALQFFQIRLYNNGEEVASGVISESNTVSVGLGGSNDANLLRFCAIFDATDEDGNAIQFDAIALWKSGVLDLQLSKLDIYYAFVQDEYDPDTDIDSPLYCKTSVISVEETEASINGEATSFVGGVAVGSTVNDISNLIDDDLDTPMTIAGGVSAGGSTIAVNLGRTLDYRHQLCIVLDNKTYVAGIGVGDWLTVKTYLNGKENDEQLNDWNVLGVDVIGFGDKRVITIQPQSAYDEVRLTIANIVGVLDIQSFYGMYIRGDIDNDGIPDCMDPESCTTSIEGVEATDVCVGDMITIKGKGMAGTEYTIQLPEQNINKTFKTDDKGNFSHTLQLNTPGRYTMTFRDGSGIMMGSAPYTVHPLTTTWRTDAASTDWNEWNNWTAGTPYCCTDAVIPQGAGHYPVLNGEVKVGDEYCVQGIHFEPGAAVDRVYKLNYDKAWVEMELEPNKYYMLAAPLKNTYTGDMFVPKDGTAAPAYFTELDGKNTPENRFDPQIYQRLWARTAPGKLIDGASDKIEISETNWSRNFNALKFNYASGANEDETGYSNAFSLWVDNGTLPETQKFRFRFPKTQTEYTYYNDFDQSETSITETGIDRTDIHRFVYENKEAGDNKAFTYERIKPAAEGSTDPVTEKIPRTVYLSGQTYTAKLNVQQTASNAEGAPEFAAANPFMSRIDVAKFLEANSEKVSGIRFYDGNTITSATLDGDGGVVSSQQGMETIQPMQGFFVVAKDATTATTELDVTFSGEMMSPDVEEVEAEADDETTQEAEAASLLRMTVKRGDAEASTVVTATGGAAMQTLIDNEVSPKVAVFTVADGRAYDIHPTDGRAEIPVGILTAEADTLTLSFTAEGGVDPADYELYDNVTGTAYPLDNELTFSNMGSSIGRFTLRDKRKASDLADEMADNLYIATQEGRAIVRSAQPVIAKVEAYTADGMKLSEYAGGLTVEAVVTIGKGVSIVRVTLESGEVKTFKVM